MGMPVSLPRRVALRRLPHPGPHPAARARGAAAGRGGRALDAPPLGVVRRVRRRLRAHDLDPRGDHDHPLRRAAAGVRRRRRADLRRLAARSVRRFYGVAPAGRRPTPERPARRAPAATSSARRPGNTGSCRLAANMPMHNGQTKPAGASVRTETNTTASVPHVRRRRSAAGAARHRAAAWPAAASPSTRRSPASPSPSHRGDIIRASLLDAPAPLRERALPVRRADRRRRVGALGARGGRRAPAPPARRGAAGRGPGESERFLTRLGAEIVPAERRRHRRAHARRVDAPRPRAPSTPRRSPRRCTSCVTRSASAGAACASPRSSSPPR